jgi:uncharacterized Zn-finger protein
MSQLETVVVEKKKVICDGSGGALGHPRVYLNIGSKDAIDCPYCGKKFVIKDKNKK